MKDLEIVNINISNIKVGKRLRALSDVKELADSMAKQGIINPIHLDQDYNLVAGLHRLEAAKLLKWKQIPATIGHYDNLAQKEIAEIDENLCRNDLTKLQRAQHITARKVAYEKLHPQTKKGGDRKSDCFEKQKKKDSFVKATAQATKRSPRSIEGD